MRDRGNEGRSEGVKKFGSRAGEGVNGSVVEDADSVRADQVLRRDAVFDEPDAYEWGAQNLGPKVR
jgi:hypothetical protein